MDNNLIMFQSVTHVMKSRDLLRNNNIFSRVVRTPIHLKNRSCGYSLLVNNNFDYALDIIGKSGIPVVGTAAVDFV